MEILKSITELNLYLQKVESQSKIGFVPTMGALHKGHVSLIEIAKRNSDIVICSIFVNPIQFDNENDFETYPLTIKDDLNLLNRFGCDIVFMPSVPEMYPNGEVSNNYDFGGVENEMEGAFRKGHFNGVGTVVARFFNIIRPDFAFFGEKDFQQLQIVKKLVEIEKMSIKIIGCPICRENDGLAMSSRNRRLSSAMRQEAVLINQILNEVQKMFKNTTVDMIYKYVTTEFEKSALKLEYFSISNIKTLKPVDFIEEGEEYRAFIAAFADDVRLIDNIIL